MIPGPITVALALLDVALDLFPQYASAEDYQQKTGQAAPAFDPGKPLKNWLDPSPLDDGDGSAAYNTLIVASTNPDGTVNSHPFSFYISVADAKAVNLMAAVDRVANIRKSFPSVPVPRRMLAAGESIRLLTPSGPIPAVYVVNDALYAAQKQQQVSASGEFMAADRILLQAIAADVAAIKARAGA